MLQLNLPPYNIKVKNENGQRKIFDILRRKYLVITPEEWVRQHFIHYLIDYKGYPISLLANEIPLSIGEKVIRADSAKSLRPNFCLQPPTSCRLSHCF